MAGFYIKSDGNGGITIGKLLSVIITIIIFISGCIVTVVAKDTQYKIDIENLKTDMKQTKELVSAHSETNAILTTQVDSIQEDVKYIKNIMIKYFEGAK